MAKEWAKWFYNSNAWKKCRELFIQHRNGLCERCLAKGIYTIGTEVHHKEELTPENINDINITLNFDNLELLCHSCHQIETHDTEPAIQDGLIFDENGNIKSLYPPQKI